jgi:hypothetical protein
MKAAAKTISRKNFDPLPPAVRISAEQIIQNMQTPPVVEIGEKPYRANDVVFFAMVIHRSNERAYWVSTDGNRDCEIRLPARAGSSVLAVHRHANGRHGAHARPPLVQARRPQLFDRIQWASAQREAWAWCVKRRDLFVEDGRNDRLKRKGLYYTRPKAGASSPW